METTLKKFIDNQKLPFAAKDIKNLGVHPQYLTIALHKGIVEKIGHGIYINPQSANDELFQLQLQRNFIYSHATALYLWGMTDRDPLTLEATVKRGYNSKSLNKAGFIIYTVKQAWFEFGKTQRETVFGNKVNVYDRERTLCDLLRSAGRQDNYLIKEAFNSYTKSSNRNFSKLLHYAEVFRVQDKIKTYLEVLV